MEPDSLVTETARVYRALFARKNNTLTAEVEPELSAVEGSSDQLIQMLINLLSNANRHTGGGEVHIRAAVNPAPFKIGKKFRCMVTVSVTHNGEGIAPDLPPHVFGRYCHGENGGSGLGLSICKAIIEEHGGEMGLEAGKTREQRCGLFCR